MSWTVYILECADRTLYTGVAKDLKRRLEDHEAGRGAKYMRGRGPFKLVYKVTCRSKSAALKREAYIKSLTRSAKLGIVAAAAT